MKKVLLPILLLAFLAGACSGSTNSATADGKKPRRCPEDYQASLKIPCYYIDGELYRYD